MIGSHIIDFIHYNFLAGLHKRWVCGTVLIIVDSEVYDVYMADIFVKFADYNKSKFYLGTEQRLRLRRLSTTACVWSPWLQLLFGASQATCPVVGGGGGERLRWVWRSNKGCKGDLLMAHGWFLNNVRGKVWIDSCIISWQLQWGKWSSGKNNSLVKLARMFISIRRLWIFLFLWWWAQKFLKMNNVLIIVKTHFYLGW